MTQCSSPMNKDITFSCYKNVIYTSKTYTHIKSESFASLGKTTFHAEPRWSSGVSSSDSHWSDISVEKRSPFIGGFKPTLM